MRGRLPQDNNFFEDQDVILEVEIPTTKRTKLYFFLEVERKEEN
jgi:hypothetical protein